HLIRVTASNRTQFALLSPTHSTLVQEETCKGLCERQVRSRCSCDEMCFKDSSCCPDFLSKCEEMKKRSTKLNDYRHKFAVTKLAFNVKHDITIPAETLSHILRCFLRDYANINILSIWRSPLFVQSRMVVKKIVIIKLLMYNYTIVQPLNRTENRPFLNSISRFSNFLYQDEMRSYLKGLTKKVSKEGSKEGSNEGFKTRDVTRMIDELPELDEEEFLPLLNDRKSNIVCACSTTLEEIYAAKYLDTWICPVQCKLVTPSDNTGSSDSLMKIVRMCSDIKTLSGTRSAQSDQLWFRFLVAVFMNPYIQLINLTDDLYISSSGVHESIHSMDSPHR
ncbi:hypothetical protein Bpfe_001302, partial [Biomphalaria pfeifferi]